MQNTLLAIIASAFIIIVGFLIGRALALLGSKAPELRKMKLDACICPLVMSCACDSFCAHRDTVNCEKYPIDIHGKKIHDIDKLGLKPHCTGSPFNCACDTASTCSGIIAGKYFKRFSDGI